MNSWFEVEERSIEDSRGARWQVKLATVLSKLTRVWLRSAFVDVDGGAGSGHARLRAGLVRRTGPGPDRPAGRHSAVHGALGHRDGGSLHVGATDAHLLPGPERARCRTLGRNCRLNNETLGPLTSGPSNFVHAPQPLWLKLRLQA